MPPDNLRHPTKSGQLHSLQKVQAMAIRNNDLRLAQQIKDSAREALRDLFATQESFYYCTLITTGEVLPPTLTAWSHEPLARYIAENNLDESEVKNIKWSYADSPYLGYGDKHFNNIKGIFSSRVKLNESMPPPIWDAEYTARLIAMERAMSELDQKGVFSTTQPRNSIFN